MNAHRLTALLIEDSPEDADLVRIMLTQSRAADIDLVHCTRLLEGVERLDQGDIDLVLLDLALPDSRGLGTIKKLQKAAPGLPIVALTGLNDETAALRAMGEGLQDYLVKGEIDSRLLTRTIRHAVERQRLVHHNRELVRMKEELEARNAELERFNYAVSHDLRTPLVTIHGFLGLLAEDTARGNVEKQEEDIRKIREAAYSMQKVLDGLLVIAETGWAIDSPRDVSIHEVAVRAADVLRPRIERCNFEIEIAEDLPSVYGDADRLLTVFEHLIDNGIQFMPDGQQTPRIEVGTVQGDTTRDDTARRDNSPIFFVRDNGIGIDPRYHERVLELFEKLDPESPGAGIGLALVKRIVQLHCGRIWIESNGDQPGSTFFFTLPGVGAHG